MGARRIWDVRAVDQAFDLLDCADADANPWDRQSMVSVKVKYVVEDKDRHGNVRLYYRRKGHPKIRLPRQRDRQSFSMPIGKPSPE